jgi:hypothetical protein
VTVNDCGVRSHQNQVPAAYKITDAGERTSHVAKGRETDPFRSTTRVLCHDKFAPVLCANDDFWLPLCT